VSLDLTWNRLPFRRNFGQGINIGLRDVSWIITPNKKNSFWILEQTKWHEPFCPESICIETWKLFLIAESPHKALFQSRTKFKEASNIRTNDSVVNVRLVGSSFGVLTVHARSVCLFLKMVCPLLFEMFDYGGIQHSYTKSFQPSCAES
jgi:hypothetical protein